MSTAQMKTGTAPAGLQSALETHASSDMSTQCMSTHCAPAGQSTVS